MEDKNIILTIEGGANLDILDFKYENDENSLYPIFRLCKPNEVKKYKLILIKEGKVNEVT